MSEPLKPPGIAAARRRAALLCGFLDTALKPVQATVDEQCLPLDANGERQGVRKARREIFPLVWFIADPGAGA
jgi:hypothetical protein